MAKYYVVSDCILDVYCVVISANNSKEAAIKAIRKAIDKYHVVYEPSNVYVDQRGFRSDRITATNIFCTSEILKDIIV